MYINNNILKQVYIMTAALFERSLNENVPRVMMYKLNILNSSLKEDYIHLYMKTVWGKAATALILQKAQHDKKKTKSRF